MQYSLRSPDFGFSTATSRTQGSSQRVSVGQTRAYAAEDVLVKDGSVHALRMVRLDPADEQGNVDRRRAGLHAGCVEAEMALIRLDQGLVGIKGRLQSA